ncbi:hypothetical protein V8F33_009015 [Rhypophila sp. PSN 637]
MSGKGCLVNLPEPILHRILEFLVPQVLARPGPNGELQIESHRDVKTRGSEYSLCHNALDALSKTSKSWRRLSLPYLYRNPVFVGPRLRLRHIQRFLQVLLQHPRRGSWVHKLMWQLPHLGPGWADQFKELRFLARQRGLPSGQSPAVRRLIKLNLEDNLFPAGGFGAIAFPILALTTRLREMVVWDCWHWEREMPDVVARDPFFSFLEGLNTPEYQAVLKDHLPCTEFQLKLSRTGRAIGPTFPPPELETMCRYYLGHLDNHDTEKEGRVMYMASVASINTMRSDFQLSGLLNEMENKLGTRRNNQTLRVHPTHFKPSKILDASAERYLHFRSALEKARNLPLCLNGERTNWRLHIDWLQELPGNQTERKSFASDLDRLDKRNETFSRTIIRCQRNLWKKIPMVSGYSLHFPLAWFIKHMAHTEPVDWPARDPPICKLRFLHPHNVRLARHLQDIDGNFGQYLQRETRNIRSMALPLRFHPGDRQQLWGSLDPSELEFVTELEITVEGLWGPLTTAMRMLERYQDCITCKLDRWGKCIKHLSLEQLQAIKRKAINHLPPNIVILRLVDWFAEYHDIPINLRRHGEASHQQAGPAAANDNRDDNDDDEDMDEDEYEEDEYEDEDEDFIDDNGTLFDPRADHSTYFYPQDTFTFPGGDEGDLFNHELWKQGHFIYSLTRRYIRALEHGLIQLFASSSEPGPSSVWRRPSLRRIEFVYTPLRHEPRRGHTGDAQVTDHVWRTWYACLEYQILVERLGEAGIEFVLYEAEEGNFTSAAFPKCRGS